MHGRLSQNRREAHLEAFRRGDAPVLIATNVAARGLHVDGVDVVVHYLPEDYKTYVHRSGRTARAGEGGMVVTLVLPDQRRDTALQQRDGGSDYSIVDMRAGDHRLRDLASWTATRGDSDLEAFTGAPSRRPARRQSSNPRGGRGRTPSGRGSRPGGRRRAARGSRR